MLLFDAYLRLEEITCPQRMNNKQVNRNCFDFNDIRIVVVNMLNGVTCKPLAETL